MHLVNTTFEIQGVSDEKIEDYIENLFHSLRMKGIIMEPLNSLILENKTYTAVSLVPEVDFLGKIGESPWIKQLLQNGVKISSSAIGEDIWGPDICGCKESSFFIFSGSHYTPLFCGDCNNLVPLYKIPYTFDPDPSYYDIISWNTEFNAWLKIEFNSKCEKNAQEQISLINSQLNKKALNLCKTIFKLTGIRTYYDLQDLRDSESCNAEFNKLCPKCSNKWLLSDTLFDEYDYKCDNCGIISNFAFNVKEECRTKSRGRC